jgi:hypothetical protein
MEVMGLLASEEKNSLNMVGLMVETEVKEALYF